MYNKCDILISNGRVVIPYHGIFDTNILIEKGKIKSIKKSVNSVQAKKTLNVSGKYVLPGIIDPHVHYGVFTPIEKSSITESRSAALGGITTMIRMLRINGSYRNLSTHLQKGKKTHFIDYAIHASILNSTHVKEMKYLSSIGVNSFKIYMNLGSDLNKILPDLNPGKYELTPIEVDMTEDLIQQILQEGSKLKSTILVHAEDHLECSYALRDFKKKSGSIEKMMLEKWSDLRPTSSEVKSIDKILRFGSPYGTDVYFVHIGSSAALNSILKNKPHYRQKIWIETCPHYLTHTIEYDDIRGKVIPPIRTKNDNISLWLALKNGQIDTIGTDHVANTLSLKVRHGNFLESLAGFPGIGTMLPVMLSEGVNKQKISIQRISEICSFNTAKAFGMFPQKGTIAAGSDADLTIVDLNKEQVVSPELLQSSSDYTIYDGWKLRGWPIITIVRGKIVMEGGHVDPINLGSGRFVETNCSK